MKKNITSFIVKIHGTSYDIVAQLFIVVDNGQAYMLGYGNTPDNFDSPRSQVILNHMLSRFRFLTPQASGIIVPIIHNQVPYSNTKA